MIVFWIWWAKICSWILKKSQKGKGKKVGNFKKNVDDFKKLFTLTNNVHEFEKQICSQIKTKDKNKTEKKHEFKRFSQIEKLGIKMKKEKQKNKKE